MIAPASRIFRPVTTTLVLLIIVVLFSLFLYVRFYLPNHIRNLLIGYAKKRNITLVIKDIHFHLPTEFVLRGVSISMVPESDSNEIVLEHISVRPDLIQSYVRCSVVIDRVELRNGKIEMGASVFSFLGGRGPHKKEEPHKTNTAFQKGLGVEVKEILARGINISFGKRERMYRLYELSGTVSGSGGRVEAILEKYKASLEFGIDSFSKSGFINTSIIFTQGVGSYISSEIPSLGLLSRWSFTFDNEIEIFGESFLLKKEKDGEDKVFSEASFEIVYSPTKDVAELKKFKLSSVGEVISLFASATVTDVRSNPYIKLETNFRIKNLDEGYRLFGTDENIAISGVLSSKRITVEGFINPRNLRLSGMLDLKDVSYRGKDNGVEIVSLNSECGVKGVMDKDGMQVSVATLEDSFFSLEVLGFSGVQFFDVKGKVKFESFDKNKFHVVLRNIGAELDGKNAKNGNLTAPKGKESKRSKVYFEKLSSGFVVYKERNKRFEGAVSAEKIRYKGLEIDRFSSQLIYKGNEVLLKDASLVSEGHALNFKRLEVLKRDVYQIRFQHSNFGLSKGSVAFNGVSGDIEIDTRKGFESSGEIRAKSVRLQTFYLTSLSSNFSYSGNELNITRLTADVFGGNLGITGSLKREEDRKVIDLEVSLVDISGGSSLDFLFLENAILRFEGFLDGKNYPFGKGVIDIKRLRIEKDERISTINAMAKIGVFKDDITISEGIVFRVGRDGIYFDGKIHSLFRKSRSSQFSFRPFSIEKLVVLVSPLLPRWLVEGEIKGTASANVTTFNLFEKLTNWEGSIRLEDVEFKGMVSGTRLLVDGVNGVISLKKHSVYKKVLDELMDDKLVLSEDVFYDYKKVFVSESFKDYGVDKLRIRNIQFGFLNFSGLNCIFELDREKLNIIHLHSRLYEGDVYAKGIFWYKRKNERYNISLLIDDISLESVVQSLPFEGDYITGIVYGLAWFSGGDEYFDVDGVFSFWTKDGKREKRAIGKDLLRKLGAKGTFFTGTSRRYNKGVISGYIKNGFITFKEFEISNKILFHRDLFIKVDEKMNSISLKHLLSVIREISRRVSEGEVEIKKN